MNAVLEDLVLDAAPPPAPRPRVPWHLRVLEAGSTYLPLLLMAVLALGTWWLVKNTPLADTDRVVAPLRHEPDYTMTQFLVRRFAASGAMRVQIEGDLMRHYPDTETYEIDNPRIRAIGEDGRVTIATARQALANRDGSEVQLSGGAHVVREATAAEPATDFRGEFLHCLQYSEQVRSHLPVVVTQGGSEVRADAMNYDNLAGLLTLKGHVRALLTPPAAKP
ncbi:MAG TPA: LPS export ABC transporter periplasmic protein LptC [Burkholderiaceae bacterium]|nr:LPS export ABC transporter periplasmic protein LptC [Burkholderiaceae bacterium]